MAAASLAGVFFGGLVFATRFVVGETDPVTLAFARFAVASVMLAPALLTWRGSPLTFRDLMSISSLGVIGFALMTSLLGFGLQSVKASEGALILTSQSFITLVLARLRGEESLSAFKLIGLLCATAGIGLVLGDSIDMAGGPPRHILSYAALVGAACCLAIYNVYSRPLLTRYPPLLLTAVATFAAAAVLLPFVAGIVIVHGVPSVTPLGWGAILYIGTFGSAVGTALWTWALRHTTPSRVAVCLALNPVAAGALGAVFLRESLTPAFFVGLTLVALGIVATNYQRRIAGLTSRPSA